MTHDAKPALGTEYAHIFKGMYDEPFIAPKALNEDTYRDLKSKHDMCRGIRKQIIDNGPLPPLPSFRYSVQDMYF